MTNAAEAVAAGTNMGRQNRLYPVAEHQIRMPDNAGTNPCLAVRPTGALSRHAIDELGFADRPQLDRAGLAVHRSRLDEHGRHNVVAAIGVGTEIVEQVAPPVTVPKMVMRVEAARDRGPAPCVG